jgi:hypothetical protein
MKRHGSTRTLCFGATMAIALAFVQLIAAPWIGRSHGLALYLGACVVAYAALLGGAPREALRNGGAALAGAAVVALVVDDLSGLAVGLTIVLSLVRSGLEPTMPPARALVVEAALGILALGFASWIAWPGILGDAAALWGFALVQSLYFLVPGRSRRLQEVAGRDPFDRAREELLGILDRA